MDREAQGAVCLEIIKGKTTAAEVARLHGLTVADVEGWLDRFMQGAEDFLKALPKEVEERHAAEKKELLAKMGDLSIQVMFKKTNGISVRDALGERE